MSEALQSIKDFRLNTLKELLAQTTEKQQHFFKRMYSHKNLDAHIEDVVDKIPNGKIDWAIQQCEATIVKNAKDANLNL